MYCSGEAVLSIARIFRGSPEKRAADAVYRRIVAQARLPVFYSDHGIPDTLDGRFEMIVLHAFLVLHRLKDFPAAAHFGQSLFDLMFADMDRSLREMGVGDLSVGRHVKQMATAFYGRTSAYQRALAEPRTLPDALRRNLLGTVPAAKPDDIDWFARYLVSQADALAALDTQRIVDGDLAFARL